MKQDPDLFAKIQRNRLSAHTWATNESFSMEARLLRWTYEAMMKQRGIVYDDIALELGVTRSAVGQAFERLLTTENLTVQSVNRLDSAISSISSKKHKALNHKFCRGENDSLCIGISLSTPDQRVAEAKYRGEYERLYNRPVPGEGFGGKPEARPARGSS